MFWLVFGAFISFGAWLASLVFAAMYLLVIRRLYAPTVILKNDREHGVVVWQRRRAAAGRHPLLVAEIAFSEDVVEPTPPPEARQAPPPRATEFPRPPLKNNEDALKQIEKLAALKSSGALTAEEFEAKKAELLRRV